MVVQTLAAGRVKRAFARNIESVALKPCFHVAENVSEFPSVETTDVSHLCQHKFWNRCAIQTVECARSRGAQRKLQ